MQTIRLVDSKGTDVLVLGFEGAVFPLALRFEGAWFGVNELEQEENGDQTAFYTKEQ